MIHIQFENEHMEFKETFVPEIYKEVIAFANTDGGIILVGVNDEGKAIGLENADDIYTRITNGIRDAILPDVTMFVKYTLERGNIIRIEVGEGSYKPYYLKSKGLKPSGVYVRQGTSAVPASQEQIRQMIKNADGDTFEILRSLNQELTFEYTTEIFKKHRIGFGTDKYYNLGIENPEVNLFTNLGLLLSDQCLHTVKTAVFADDQNTIFRDKKEFSGSILKQLEETHAYLKLCNKNQAVIKGLEREDRWDYPEEAVREALLNAIIHRDYSYSGSIIINVNDKQMEFISIGGLLSGLSTEDIKSGISLSRNNRLTEVFHRLHFVESYGTGIRRIFSLYQNCVVQPAILVTPNTFKIVLPNMNAFGVDDKVAVVSERVRKTAQMDRILAYITEYGKITEKEIQELLNVKKTRAYIIAKQMVEGGFIEAVGRGENKIYTGRSK